MNLLIVFAFAGDSTMTRFLAIAERPKLATPDAGIPRARIMRARTRGAGSIEARTIAPRRQEGQKRYWPVESAGLDYDSSSSSSPPPAALYFFVLL